MFHLPLKKAFAIAPIVTEITRDIMCSMFNLSRVFLHVDREYLGRFFTKTSRLGILVIPKMVLRHTKACGWKRFCKGKVPYQVDGTINCVWQQTPTEANGWPFLVPSPPHLCHCSVHFVDMLWFKFSFGAKFFKTGSVFSFVVYSLP
mgnify:CR=1 FL=1